MFVFFHRAVSKNILPRVAALLDVSQVSEILSVEDEATFTRPIYAGNAIATVKSTDAVKVLTVRATAFAKAAEDGHGPAEIEQVDTSALAVSDKAEFVSVALKQSDRPDLASANIVVAGGRALKVCQLYKAKSRKNLQSTISNAFVFS